MSESTAKLYEYGFIHCPRCDSFEQTHGVVKPPKCPACKGKREVYDPNSHSSEDPSFAIFKGAPINRLLILHEIGDCFQSVMQWSDHEGTSSASRVHEYTAKAEVLICMLETLDCGSVGGFDDGFNRPKTLMGRWDWLYRKYHDPTGERFGCAIVSYEDICDYFKYDPSQYLEEVGA